MKTRTVAEIAAEFCADRVAEREALRAMLPCVLDREENGEVEFYGGREERCPNCNCVSRGE